MLARFFSSFLVVLIFSSPNAQVVSGPMLGQVELRNARVWLEVRPEVKSLKLTYRKKGNAASAKTIPYKGELGKDFNPVQFDIGGLDMNSTYEYGFIIDGKTARQKGEFTTKDLWQYRKPAPDFSFLTGSCAYFNEPVYDRPGKPYGGDSSIFETMAREKAAFMLWTGDNWYTREVDYFSNWGMWYRPHRDRSLAVLQPFLKAMPHYASWDDHDFGPNNSGSSFVLKEESRKVFMNYWSNPSYGQDDEGIYTMLSYSDVDLFLCDDRWWRTPDDVEDSLNGQPNPAKVMLGQKQMQWLKNALLFSNASFKIIVMGSQVLNANPGADSFRGYTNEYQDLMNFLRQYRLNGVLFLSGDVHRSEIIKTERPGHYPLYDVTVSPLTSGTSRGLPNPNRIFGAIDQQNYGRISVTGARGSRRLSVDFLGIKGENLGSWSVLQTELQTPKP